VVESEKESMFGVVSAVVPVHVVSETFSGWKLSIIVSLTV
jgi:hypothetical protein